MQSQVRFNRVPEKLPEKVWEALVQSQVRFNRVPKKVPEKVPGDFGAAEPGQVQQGSGEGSGEGLGGLPGQVQQGTFRRRFPRRFREALMQSQVKFNRAPEKVQKQSGEGSGEGLGGFGARSGQQGFRRKVPGGFGAGPGQVQGVQEEVPEKVAEKVLEKFVFRLFVCMHVHTGDLLCGCWGYHRSLLKLPPPPWAVLLVMK